MAGIRYSIVSFMICAKITSERDRESLKAEPLDQSAAEVQGLRVTLVV